jgi:hypothetical protein
MLFDGAHGTGRQPQADPAAKDLALHRGMLQVRKKTPTRLVVRVTDIIARHHGFAGDLTTLGHVSAPIFPDIRRVRRGVATIRSALNNDVNNDAWV